MPQDRFLSIFLHFQVFTKTLNIRHCLEKLYSSTVKYSFALYRFLV